MATVSSTLGSSTSIFWKRRASARSRSMCLKSEWVVAPMHRILPLESEGLRMVLASIELPLVEPAPTME